VVGVLEEMESSVRVLEAYLPKYFGGAREILSSNEAIQHVNRNIYKQPQTTELRQMLAGNMSREIDFYNYCRQRLRKQYLLLNED
jgi:dermatan/chondrotin sulfate uronyl 2-O-sulfotransferase UST